MHLVKNKSPFNLFDSAIARADRALRLPYDTIGSLPPTTIDGLMVLLEDRRKKFAGFTTVALVASLLRFGEAPRHLKDAFQM